jgi:hypothetical protein
MSPYPHHLLARWLLDVETIFIPSLNDSSSICRVHAKPSNSFLQGSMPSYSALRQCTFKKTTGQGLMGLTGSIAPLLEAD